MSAPDVIIIGSGMGGATLASALAPSGLKVLILERGERLSPTKKDRDARAVFGDGTFRPDEMWLDAGGQPFSPGNYYNVGGNSKFYGAALIRYRAEDFDETQHRGGTTPGWPITYDDLEADYQAAEELYHVRGRVGEDPTEPVHSGSYPFPPVPHEPSLENLRERLKRVGLSPSPVPLGVDLQRWLADGQTTWDGFPDTCGGKMDAETRGLADALEHENVTLKTGCKIERLVADADGRITEVRWDGGSTSAPIVVLAAGAVQSAALLLRSADATWCDGLANSSDQVGRNFMNHNCSAVLALHPLRRNRAIYQKTLMMNDFYLSDGEGGAPLGNVQMLGKITGPILQATTRLPGPLARFIAARSFDFYAMSEDLPNPESRVTLQDDHIKLDWRRSNWAAHEGLVAKLKAKLKEAGFPIVLSRAFDRRTPSHQSGTARMGQDPRASVVDTFCRSHDPRASVVDTFCRSHDHGNLFITDASVLPTSAAVNPALTVAALSLRAGRHILETEFAQ